MAKNWTKAELVKRAIEDSVAWNESYLDSIANCDDEEMNNARADTENLLVHLRRYYNQRFGELYE